MTIHQAIKKFIGKVKENYNYYKLGRKAEFDAERVELIRKNKLRMKNIREGNPEENFKLDKYN